MSHDVTAINAATPPNPGGTSRTDSLREGRETRLSRRFKVLAAVVLFAPPAMVACGDDGGGGGAATTADAPTEAAAGQPGTTAGGDTAVGQPGTTAGGDTTATTAPPAEATSTQPTAGASPAPTTTAVERPSQPVDQLVPIDRGQMAFRCVGAGPATVMLIAGWMDSGDKWGAIEPAVAENARVCSYARFGTGTSDAPTTTQTFATQADDLHELLDAAGEPGPYLLVGHSFGGAIAVTFASKYGDEVAGLVLLDTTPIGWPDVVCSVPAYQAGCAVMHDPALDPERVDVFPAFAVVATITSLGDLPMTVMTAAHRDGTGLAPGELERLDALWAEGQEHWATLSSSSTIVTVDDTGHHIEVDQPQLVIDELLKLLP
jgi:pimeloyl-ACP methyl ester carboxylesterase